MEERDGKRRRGPSDPADYSSTQAPATRKHAEGRKQPLPSDERLQPGGPAGAPDDPGIGSLDPESATAGRAGTDLGPPDRDEER